MKPIRILQLLFQGWLLGFLHRNGHGLSNTTEPGYLDFDNLPETNFTCQGKVIGGYYADLETECQMFHVCTIGQLEEPMDIKFLCLNGTVFDQETRVCERVDEVDCSRSEKFYSLNLELYGNTIPPPVEDLEGKEEGTEEHNYSDEFSSAPTIPQLTTATPIVTTVKISPSSTTKTPPRVNKTVQALSSYPTANEEDYNYPTDSDEDSDKCPGQENDQQYNVYGSDSKNQNCDKIVDTKLINRPSSHSFSPQQFILKHADIHADQKNPAISFQRQFQNGGTNTLVTVTTHTNLFQERETQSLYHDQNGYPTSTQESGFREYTDRPIIHSTERTPLIPLPNSQDRVPTGHPGLPSKTNSYGSLYGYAQDDSEKNSRYNPIDGQELRLQFRQNREPNHSEFKKKEPRVFTRSENRTEVNSFTHSPYSGALPRVIVTATATVRDGSGKKLNYTVSSVIGGAGDKMPPASYDDYKESDVLLDPFFLDVPKIKRTRRSARLKSN